MAQLLDAVETRLDDILLTARGQTGMGTDAAARFFPAARLRRNVLHGWLRDPEYPGAAFDRAYEYDWRSVADTPGTNNDLQGPAYRAFTLHLHVGYLYGDALAAYVKTTGSEVASTVVRDVKKRALSEAERIRRALCLPAIFAASGDDPAIYNVERQRSDVEDLGAGRLVCTSVYTIEVMADNATNYDP